MVSLRCKMMVTKELEKLGLEHSIVELGTVDLRQEITDNQRLELAENLRSAGLEVMDDNKSILIEKIKNVIIEMIHHTDEVPKVNYSDHLSQMLGYNYTYLSNIFSEAKGTTIQQFIILHKVERVKELILYDELSLSEIAYKLHYSSPAHLSNQFKKITGLTPSFFKKMKHKRQQNLENM